MFDRQLTFRGIFLFRFLCVPFPMCFDLSGVAFARGERNADGEWKTDLRIWLTVGGLIIHQKEQQTMSFGTVKTRHAWIFCWLLFSAITSAFVIEAPPHSIRPSLSKLANLYDDWRSDAVVPTLPLDEENVRETLQLFIDSDYGTTMFGKHGKAASVGITGELELVDIEGPEVVLKLSGRFWHRRETVLGRAAVWLNAVIPEIVEVRVQDMEELQDFKPIVDECTGELLYTKDKRAEDFNGDRGTMEYQGIDPDVRGPFPPGVGDSFTINPV